MRFLLALLLMLPSVASFSQMSVRQILSPDELPSYDTCTYGIIGEKATISTPGQSVFLDVPMTLAEGKEYSLVVVRSDIDSLSFTRLTPFIVSGFSDYKNKITIELHGENGVKKIKQTIDNVPPGKTALISNDAITLGILFLVLLVIFTTSNSPRFKRFYKYVPALLLCYFIPGLLNTFHIIDAHHSNLYYVSSRFLLPASIVLLVLSVDLKAIKKLGSKAIIMFFTATVGIIIGGPIALWIVAKFNPDVLMDASGIENWRGFATVAGSWIGGGANQTAMKEIYNTPSSLFQKMIVVDVFIANLWMAFLLYGAGIKDKVDIWLKADNSAIKELEVKMETFQSQVARQTSFMDLLKIVAIGFMGVALGHLVSDLIAGPISNAINDALADNPDSGIKYFTALGNGFFWIVIIATIFGLIMSNTKAKLLEGSGASKIGSLFLYVLVLSIGMEMDIQKLINEWKDFKFIIIVGLIWMAVHIIFLLTIAKLIKAPFFFVAIGSQANVGGAASAPVVASAFNPVLAPVGVLLAILGYVVGTIGALACASMMKAVTVSALGA